MNNSLLPSNVYVCAVLAPVPRPSDHPLSNGTARRRQPIISVVGGAAAANDDSAPGARTSERSKPSIVTAHDAVGGTSGGSDQYEQGRIGYDPLRSDSERRARGQLYLQ